MKFVFRTLCVLLGLSSLVTASKPAPVKVHFIRHGEKPHNKHDFRLSREGKIRAQCIADLFSQEPPYNNIGKIIVQRPKKSGRRSRPLKTVIPLADRLRLKVDDSCEREDVKCVQWLVRKWQEKVDRREKEGDVLVCWEHRGLKHVMRSLEVRRPPSYPSDRYDLIYTVQHGKLVSTASEECDRLDSNDFLVV